MLLAFPEYSINPLALFSRKVQVPFHAPEELDSYAVGRKRGDWLGRVGDVEILCLMSMGPLGIANQEPSRHHAGAEDEHRGEDNFPGIHQVESAG